MILANVRIEPRSNRPSALQLAINAWMLALNGAMAAASLASPFHWTMMAWRFNRALTKAWGFA